MVQGVQHRQVLQGSLPHLHPPKQGPSAPRLMAPSQPLLLQTPAVVALVVVVPLTLVALLHGFGRLFAGGGKAAWRWHRQLFGFQDASGKRLCGLVNGTSIAGVLLHALPSELEAFWCLEALVAAKAPTYFTPNLGGAAAGACLVDRCLAVVDPELYARLTPPPPSPRLGTRRRASSSGSSLISTLIALIFESSHQQYPICAKELKVVRRIARGLVSDALL